MQDQTRIIHELDGDPLTGAISTPIYQTSTFVQDHRNDGSWCYARTGNPTRSALEKLVTSLESAHAAYAFGSGIAAIDSVLKCLSTGDHILAVDDIYGGAFRLFEQVYRKLGIEISYADATDTEAFASQIQANTKLIWLESPTNPCLKISDIRAISRLAKAQGAYLVVDNTFASPLYQKPIELGADLVIHSATKYLAGHSDVLLGLVACANEEVASKIQFNQNAGGAVPGPWDCWLCIRGIQSLALRLPQQGRNALQLARFLEDQEEIELVNYPGLQSHPQHNLAKTQQEDFGGVLSFSFKDDRQQNALDFVRSTRLFKLAESLGGVKSLCCHPTTMTHASVPAEHRKISGVHDSLVRLSCGIEDPRDLIEDVRQALQLVKEKSQVLVNA
jgi:cystathionine beta-lyase